MATSAASLKCLTDDPFLDPYRERFAARRQYADALAARLTEGSGSLADFASGHEFYGLHWCRGEWTFTEWAPNATAIHLVDDGTGWRQSDAMALARLDDYGNWRITLPGDRLKHGDRYCLRVDWPGGGGDRIPAYARRVVQDADSGIFNAQVWRPAPFCWQHARRPLAAPPLIYEAHVGIAQEAEAVGSYQAFREHILPRIQAAGYNAIQLMAVLEHPYYGSFGYHVSSFFAASSRFGTPEDLKALIDSAHGMGLSVIIDLVHSHAVRNEVEGLSRFDGTLSQYFHAGERGEHRNWDSRCFDYGKPQVLHFLLSNCRFWLDEYRVDGFRFDGVTSMIYRDHGLERAFTSYAPYFDDTNVDADALAYLTLANTVIHEVAPGAVTFAEDVSGMPGLGASPAEGGCGFDYRLAMGVPDCWFKLANDVPDERWDMDFLWRELTSRRAEERTVSYVESHDQALVGGKSMIFELIDAAMYSAMDTGNQDLTVARGVALHKMMRLATAATAGHGYLTFMGNEFGHPEWIDFPRAGNNWSYRHARRLWHLRDDPGLKYHFLADFDEAMLKQLTDAGVLGNPHCDLLHLHNDAKIFAFQRGSCIFAFNFHPDRSVVDHPLPVATGEYRLALDTDAASFGGQGRLTPAQRFHAVPDTQGRAVVRVYLPCRTALVLRRQPGAPPTATGDRDENG